MAQFAKLIVNPVAGTDAAPDHLPTMNERLRQAFDSVDIAITTGPGDATRIASEAAADGYRQIFVAGGDGTVNEVLNGVARVPGGLQAVTFGVIPLGTGNDFATALGIPHDVEQAIHTLIDGTPAPVDLGSLNDVYFVNVSAGGFIAEVSDAVSPRMKTVAGKLAYLIGGAQVMFDYEPLQARVLIRTAADVPDGTQLDLSLHTFAICNSPMVGGGRLIAPRAQLDDGWVDVCLIRAMSTLDFLRLLTRVSDGEHVHDERVMYFRARELDIDFDRPVAVNTDGQVLETSHCRYRLLHHAVRFLAPTRHASDSLTRSS